jgi:hypothetical protein
MNNTFKLNHVYSNSAFYAGVVKLAVNLAHFNCSLYKKNPENCPWPKTREYSRRMLNETKEVFTYFEVIKRTRCYITVAVNDSYKLKCKIRIDDEGNEFIIIDNTVLHASDMLKLTSDEAKQCLNESRTKYQEMNVFLRKLSEIEEYGYAYTSIAHKVTTEKELREHLGFNEWL